MTDSSAGRRLAQELAVASVDVSFVWRLSPDPGFEYLDDSVAAFLGPTSEDFTANPGRIGQMLQTRCSAVGEAIETAADGDTFELELEFATATGEPFIVACICRKQRRRDGSEVLVGVGRDVTEKTLRYRALADSERLYRQLGENSADFAMQTSPDRTITFVSSSVVDVLGWRPEELLGHKTYEFIHPDDLAIAEEYSRRVNEGEAVYLRTRLRRADGTYRWLAQHVRPVHHGTDQVTARAGVWRDVTAEVEALTALEESEQRFRLAMQSAPTGIAILGIDGAFQSVNPTLCKLLGRSEEWLLRRRLADVLHPDHAVSTPSADDFDAEAGTVRHDELCFVRADGSQVWLEQAVAIMRGPHGESTGYVAHFLDVTEARAAHEQLHFLANHDDLTGQLRPAALSRELTRLLSEQARTDGAATAVLFVDVDALKEVNDTLGHEAGDLVIKEVARKIAQTVRRSDLVARIGGDEFVVVLPQVASVADAELVAQKVHSGFDEPVMIGQHQRQVGVSIGLCLAEPGESAEQVLHRADTALYRSKRDGRARTSVYDPRLDGGGGTGPVSPTPGS